MRGNHRLCRACARVQGGSLLCCDGCPASYHLRCIGEHAKSLPPGDWLCPECALGGRGAPWRPLAAVLEPFGVGHVTCSNGLLMASHEIANTALPAPVRSCYLPLLPCRTLHKHTS